MPGSTPIYGFPYPDPSDLVANYPALGQDLAEDIETVIDNLPAGGFSAAAPTTIANSGGSASTTANVTTFTAVNSISLNGVFSATYQNYKVLVSYVMSVQDNVGLRLRAAGSDNSTASSYLTQTVRGSSTTASAFTLTDNIAAQGFLSGDTITAGISCEVFDPFLASPTVWLSTGRSRDDYAGLFTVRHNQSTSYDGFSIIPATGTITGTVAVYGYQK
jgi:hypothetical protein